MTSKTQYHIVAASLMVIGICLVMAIMAGCIEEEQKPQQWGTGDLPPGWQERFGTDNGSRMNFVQSQAITEIASRLRTLEINQSDPNAIRDLKRRISELENGND